MSIQVSVAQDVRPVWRAIGNGIRCRCPNCGEGKLYRAYLKVADTCSNCGEQLHWHKADDMPPYIAIFIVGHLLIGLILHLETSTRIDPFWYLATMVPAALILPLIMLPSIKGAVVGLQWAKYMHGFDPTHRDPADPDAI